MPQIVRWYLHSSQLFILYSGTTYCSIYLTGAGVFDGVAVNRGAGADDCCVGDALASGDAASGLGEAVGVSSVGGEALPMSGSSSFFSSFILSGGDLRCSDRPVSSKSSN